MKSEAGKDLFDVRKWLSVTRDRHYQETNDMTPDELLRRLRRRATDPRLAEFFDRIKVVKPVGVTLGVQPFRDGPGWLARTPFGWMTLESCERRSRMKGRVLPLICGMGTRRARLRAQ